MKRNFNFILLLFMSFALVFFICMSIGINAGSNEESSETTEHTVEELPEIEIIEEEPVIEEEPIDVKELELLAHLIYAEAGADWCADEMLYGVGSVVLNRMASDLFPDTMYEVIYQTGPTLQYACTVDGNIEKEPDERAYRIAEDLLRNGPTMPPNVVFQAEFEQGDGTYCSVQTMYFCYVSEEPIEEDWR